MLKISHAYTVTVAAILGFNFLWLERIYSNTPLLGDITASSDSLITIFAQLVAAATSPGIAITVALMAALFAIHEHHARLWWFSVTVLLTGVAASFFLKELIMLPRPEYALISLGSYGFPSTHATIATIISLGGIWFIYHWKHLPYRRMMMHLLIIGWVIICLSRILLGVHGVSDVLSGILLGSVISTIGILSIPTILHDQNLIKQKKHEAT